MSYTSFVANLKQYKGQLPPAIQEEYLRADGTLDTKYISSLLGSGITEAKFRSVVNAELGTVIFTKGSNTNEVSKELFEQHYTFGTYPDVRGWIGYMARVLDVVLTKEALFEYLSNQA